MDYTHKKKDAPPTPEFIRRYNATFKYDPVRANFLLLCWIEADEKGELVFFSQEHLHDRMVGRFGEDLKVNHLRKLLRELGKAEGE